MRCSGVRPPPKLGPIFMTIAVLVPRLRIAPVTAPSRTVRMDPTPMLVPVPIITPSSVRNDRTLFSRSVARASPITDSSRFMRVSRLTCRPQGHDRVQAGRSPRRIGSEEQAHDYRQGHSDEDAVERS